MSTRIQMMVRRSFPVLSIYAAATMGLGALCSGNGGGGGGGSSGEAAAINFQLKVEQSDSFALKPYNIAVTWQAQLLSGEGSTGNADPFSLNQAYSGTSDTSGDYVVKKLATNERPGTWRFTVSSDLAGWSTQCEKTLPAGALTSVNFTHGKTGCSIGALFP